MKKFAIALLATIPIFGAGSVGQSINPLGPPTPNSGLPDNRTYVMSISWIGDSVNGTVPSTVINIASLPQIQGMRLFQIEIQPGTPSPTSLYGITLTDSSGVDLLQGQGANLSATNAFYTGSLLSPPLLNSPTFALTGNSVASARGTVTLYFAPLSTVAAARGLPATLSANNSFTGPMTIGNIDNIRHIDGTKFAKTAVGINAADTDCGAGTACVIEVEYPGTYSDATITLTKNHFLRFRSGGIYVHRGIVGPDSNTDTSAVWGVTCPEHATLQLANASNVDAITDTNFATLSGTGNTFGTFGFTLQGCTLDGNKANQAALVTTGACTVSTVARTAGGVVTITCSNTPSPAFAAGMTVDVGGTGAIANQITNDTSSFNGRFIVQSATATSFTYNQTARNTIASVAATGTTPTAVGYSGSNCLRIFGRNMTIDDVSIGNCILDGQWNEGYSPSFVDLTSRLESTFRRERMVNSGGDGWVYWGPQNSRAHDIVTFGNGQWGNQVQEPLFSVETVDFLNSLGGTRIIGSGAIQGADLQPTSAAGWGLLIDTGASPSVITTSVYACAGCISLELRAGEQQLSGLVNNGATGVKYNGGSGMLSVLMGNNTTWFDCTSITGRNSLDFWNTDGVGTPLAGNCGASFGSGSFQNTWVRGLAGLANVTVIPSPTIASGGWTQTIPTGANSTFALLGLAQTFTAAQSFGAGDLLPSAAGGTDLGSTALPFGNAWLGTAGTNNFKFAPAATSAARVISIPDPGINTNLALNLTATSAAFATATTAGTCVQNTTAVAGAATTMGVSVSPVSTPGVGAVWSAFVSSAGNVTINECAVATSAGGSIAFNIRVTP